MQGTDLFCDPVLYIVTSLADIKPDIFLIDLIVSRVPH
jgi:hypothetical protein